MNRWTWRLAVMGLVVGLAGLSGAAAASQSALDPKTLKNPQAAEPMSAERGQAVYMKFCRQCHGADAKGGRVALSAGGNVPPDLTDATWAHGSTDGEIFTTIRGGVAPKYDMDSYEGKVTDDDIWDVVTYLRSIGAKPAGQ